MYGTTTRAGSGSRLDRGSAKRYILSNRSAGKGMEDETGRGGEGPWPVGELRQRPGQVRGNRDRLRQPHPAAALPDPACLLMVQGQRPIFGMRGGGPVPVELAPSRRRSVTERKREQTRVISSDIITGNDRVCPTAQRQGSRCGGASQESKLEVEVNEEKSRRADLRGESAVVPVPLGMYRVWRP